MGIAPGKQTSVRGKLFSHVHSTARKAGHHRQKCSKATGTSNDAHTEQKPTMLHPRLALLVRHGIYSNKCLAIKPY